MQVARLIIVSILILAILSMYSPPAREEVSRFWEQVRRGVLAFMDDLYTTIRDFVAGPDSNDGIQDTAPGVDFEIILTMARGSSSTN